MPQIIVKWSGKEYEVELPEEDTVASLKRVLQEKTAVRCPSAALVSPDAT
jgi:hypothetical protein